MTSKLKDCEDCGRPFRSKSNRQTRCKLCQLHHRIELNCQYKRDSRKRLGYKNKKKLGTGYFLEGPIKENPLEEAQLIKKELEILRLPSKIAEKGLSKC